MLLFFTSWDKTCGKYLKHKISGYCSIEAIEQWDASTNENYMIRKWSTCLGRKYSNESQRPRCNSEIFHWDAMLMMLGNQSAFWLFCVFKMILVRYYHFRFFSSASASRIGIVKT